MCDDLEVTFARVQLNSGFVTSVLCDTRQPITCIEGSYMINMRKRMNKIGNAKLWIKGSWAPKLQQVNNVLIMERIGKLKGIIKGGLKQVNSGRLWMRVVTVADVANKAR